MKHLQLFEDAACTKLFGNFPFIPFEYGGILGGATTVTVGDTVYQAFIGNYFSGVSAPSIDPNNMPFYSLDNRFPSGKMFYTKSGLRFSVQEASGQNEFCKTGDIFLGLQKLADGGQVMISGEMYLVWWLGEFTYADTKYYSIIGWASTAPDYFVTLFAAEESFWTEIVMPDYDYGDKPSTEGGQGTGSIPHIDIPLSATPSRMIPLGGRGLHAYRITAAGYADVQGYLWGDSSTLAKSLWQKFQNKTHSPVSCIVGCFTLPSDFMPSAVSSSGVQLAGLMLSPVSGCNDISSVIGFKDITYTLGAVTPPFDSWLDYTGISAVLHLPFCGDIMLSPEFVIGKEVAVRYRVDQMNGNIIALVYSDGRVIAETSGNCAYNIPVSGGDSGTLERLGAVLTGTLQLASGNVGGALGSAAEAVGANYETHLVNSDMRGSVSACENRTIYIEWIAPETAYTGDYKNANGLPCEFSGTLSSFHGYGEFEILSASTTGNVFYVPNATDAEKAEIADLLKGGVIV